MKVKHEKEIRKEYREDKTRTACFWVWKRGDPSEFHRRHIIWTIVSCQEPILYSGGTGCFSNSVFQFLSKDIENKTTRSNHRKKWTQQDSKPAFFYCISE